jgi:hypothetical protein
MISPTGINTAARHTTDTIASGGGEPVSGSFLWELIHFRIRGSAMITIIDPTPMPENARPEKPGDHPLMSVKMMGYATKHLVNVAYD